MVLYAKLLHRVTGKLPDVKAVNDTTGFWEGLTDNLSNRIRQIKGNFLAYKIFNLVNT